MHSIQSYSIAVFVVILISGCIINLLEQHYIIQLAGIALFFAFPLFRLLAETMDSPVISMGKIVSLFLPSLMGISACLISMVLGFWVFPQIRKRLLE